MADASGTPSTNYSIPKLNTAVDPPSGKGENTIVDFIDNLLKTKFTEKPTGIVSGEVPVWNGTNWVRSSVTPLGHSSLTNAPGSELSYVEFSTSVTANTVAEASAVTVVSATGIAFDGTTTVKVQFWCPGLAFGSATTTAGLNLWMDGADQGRLYDTASAAPASGTYPVGVMEREMTPSAATHTFSVRIWSVAAINFIAIAGAGGAGTRLPGFIRVVRA